MWFLYLGIFSLAICISAVLTFLARVIAYRYGIVDIPNARKVHYHPIALLGGMGPALAWMLIIIFTWLYNPALLLDGRISMGLLVGLCVATIVILVGGYIDDRYGARPIIQLVFPVIAIVIMLLSGLRIHGVTNPLGGTIGVAPLISACIVLVWILAISMTTKIQDGIDGLVGGLGVIGGLIIFAVSLFWDVPSSATSLLALVFAGCMAGFLILNWHPASVFLGEGGSIWCGFMLAALSIISGSKIATTVLLLSLPIFDVTWAIIRRWYGRRPITQGDAQHIHHELLRRNFSHQQIILIFYCISTTLGIISLYVSTLTKIFLFLSVIFFLSILLALSYRHKHASA